MRKLKFLKNDKARLPYFSTINQSVRLIQTTRPIHTNRQTRTDNNKKHRNRQTGV